MTSLPIRSHPLDRAPIVDRSNGWLQHAWDRGWLPAPSLQPEELWDAAAKGFGDRAEEAEIAGRSPEDVADFRLRLENLCNAIMTEADLNPMGQAMAWGQLVRVIRNRLRFGALWAQRPELLATKLAPPIIVIGHMRSGTTRIHKLLAADPAHSATRYCDASHPVPSFPDMRRLKGAFDLMMLRRINPWIDTIHPMASGEVEEELGWLAAALNHSIYESQWRIPSYSAFSEARDPAPIYREFARMLKTDAAHRGLAAHPRVLKVPAFSEDLSTLLAQFPDARIVLAEREPEAVLRSAVSLVANQMAIQCDSCDLGWIESEWRRKLDLREARMGAALSEWEGPVARLNFDDLNADWEREIRRTYRELGMPFTREALMAMRREMSGSESGQHRAHSQQLAHFASIAAPAG
ncbi:sulfotransferase family protein [Erythrobacter rubeus]|uniref:Sulfotransferase n=1 Tax=Erythrobacter rubeus TaxID=2760803 RepID=A0ABR8KLI4_9SPHN|nr:sulfotransferase [Erythrobacter rubeus]MBD2841283.1 sulfotransferase [Erythrobacter rubeus]